MEQENETNEPQVPVKLDDEEKEQQEKWDKEKQRADQAESVAKKAREEAQALSDALAESQGKIAQLEEKIKDTSKEYQQAKDDLDEMDPLAVDQTVINNVKRLKTRLEKLEKENQGLNLKAKAYEEAEIKRKQQVEKQETIEKILKPLDEEFGAKYRNDAVNLADELVDSGKEKQPTDPIEAMLLMRKCYKQVIEKSKPKEKTTVPSDSGLGGISHQEPKGKTGALNEVLADMRKNPSSWRGKT